MSFIGSRACIPRTGNSHSIFMLLSKSARSSSKATIAAILKSGQSVPVRAQIFREFSRADNWPESALEKSAVVHQSQAELWVCVLRLRRADKVNVKSTTLAFTG